MICKSFPTVKIALCALFWVVAAFVPTHDTHAQVWDVVELETVVTATTTRYATVEVNFPPEVAGHSVWYESAMIALPEDNNYYNIYTTTGDQCYPQAGGTTGFDSLGTFFLDSTERQTSNTQYNSPPCNVTGTYYWIFRDNTASTPLLYYWSIDYNATTDTYSAAGENEQLQIPTTPYINIVSPNYGVTVDNTFDYQIHFKTPPSIDIRPTTTRTVVINDAVTFEEQYRSEVVLESGASENTTITDNITLTDGSKFIYAYYTAETGAVYSDIAESFFNVNVNTYAQATGLDSPRDNFTETQIDCESFDIGCQFQKAMMFLFYPSDASLDRYANLWRNVATKKPFGYITQTAAALQGLNESSSVPNAFDLGEIPFMDAIFSPMKLAIGSMLWVFYAIYFYHRRLKLLDI